MFKFTLPFPELVLADARFVLCQTPAVGGWLCFSELRGTEYCCSAGLECELNERWVQEFVEKEIVCCNAAGEVRVGNKWP